jgi:hypothetical protein
MPRKHGSCCPPCCPGKVVQHARSTRGRTGGPSWCEWFADYGPEPPTNPGQFWNAGKFSSVVHGVIQTLPNKGTGAPAETTLIAGWSKLNWISTVPGPAPLGTGVATPDANNGLAKFGFVASEMPGGARSPWPLHHWPTISWTVAPDGTADANAAVAAVATATANRNFMPSPPLVGRVNRTAVRPLVQPQTAV